MCTGRPADISTACSATIRCIDSASTSCSVSNVWNSGVVLNAIPSRSAGRRWLSRLSSVKCDRTPPMTDAAIPVRVSASRVAVTVVASLTCSIASNGITRRTSCGASAAATAASGLEDPSVTSLTSSGSPSAAARASAAGQVGVVRFSSTTRKVPSAHGGDGIRRCRSLHADLREEAGLMQDQ